MKKIDTTPMVAQPPKPLVYKAMEEIPVVLADLKPNHDNEVTIVASTLVQRLRTNGNSFAAAHWAIHSMVVESLLVAKVVVDCLPMEIKTRTEGFRHLGGPTRVVSETFGGGTVERPIPATGTAPFEHFRVVASPSLWEWWAKRQ